MWRRTRVLTGWAAWGLCVALGSEAAAAEWWAEPTFSAKGEYNSNLILTSAPHDPTYGHWLSSGVTFGGSSENLDVSGKMAGDVVRYYGGREQSLTNLYSPLAVKYRLGRETVGFDGGFTRDNTLMGELLTTGLVLNFTQRNLWTAAPLWKHAFTERFSVQGSYHYSQASYENGARLGLVDYRVQGGTAGANYRWADRTVLGVMGTYTTFVVPDRQLTSDLVGVRVSVEHDFHETVHGSLALGPQVVQSSLQIGTLGLSDSQTTWTGRASLRKEWTNGSAELELAREVNPSGFGRLIVTERIGATFTRTVSERLTIGFNAQIYWVSGLSAETVVAPFPETRYLSIGPHVSWHITEWLAATINYGYAERTLQQFNDRASAHMTTFSLSYTPIRWTVGR